MRAGEVHGIEFIPELAEVARRRGLHVQGTDLNDGLPYPDGYFDVVHGNQVIEHLQNTDVLLKECRRVLKDSGYCVLSTNNLASWHNVFSLILGMQPPPMHISSEIVLGNRFDPVRGQNHPHAGNCHYRVFAYQGFKELCEYHGLRVEVPLTVGYYPLPPRIARLATSLDPRHGSFLTFRLQKSRGTHGERR